MKRVRVFKALFLAVLVLAVGTLPCTYAFASWQENGNPLCTAANDQWAESITSDGAGGAITAWMDYRSGTNWDIYAQRVDASGCALWATNGSAVCTADSGQASVEITSDGAGGAIVTWGDRRRGQWDIYAQRVSASGLVMWADTSVAICELSGDQAVPQMISDGAGGAIITWEDSRSGSYDIYVQRVDASGNWMWTNSGVAVCTALRDQYVPKITSDGAGGAIITWVDRRNDCNDIYAQRVSASGTVLWTANGVAICTAPGGWVVYPEVTSYNIVSDGSNGAIITWVDCRNSSRDIYAQRVNASGTVMWVVNGVGICATAGTQTNPELTSDGSGGAIITWQDDRSGDYDVYAQRVNASGTRLWAANGVTICTASGDKYYPQLTSDGAGGAVITWLDGRNTGYDVYAQRVNASGVSSWAANGVGICLADSSQGLPQITSDGAAGAIIAWVDGRNTGYDVYAGHVPPACEFASWEEDGNPVSIATGDQWYQKISSDGSGGAIILWEDHRSGNDDLYAQRMDASGCPLWTANGVGVCTADSNQWGPQITSDGSGGAIMAWEDYRDANWDIYAQRIDALGTVNWGSNGLAISTLAFAQQRYPQICSDGAGGAIMVWQDNRSGISWDVFAQRVDALGNLKWVANGLSICTAAGDQLNPRLTSDGAGGAIITWQDHRSASWDLYAQRVDALGSMSWTGDGLAVCTADSNQTYPELTSDGAGGAIITWQDHRSPSWDLYAQRVDALGNVQWSTNGVAICTLAGNQWYQKISSDGAGGAIIVWQDDRSGIGDIYAQRVDALGSVKWTANGVAVSTAAGNQLNCRLTSDGSGGAIITWQDQRMGIYPDIYAQRVDALGSMLWAANGVGICTADSNQSYPELTSDGFAGAIITWEDHRNDNSYDVYAERITVAGTIDVPGTPAAVKVVTGLSQNAPNPFNPLTRIKFTVAVPGEVSLRIYDIAGRVLRTLVEGWREAGVYSEMWDGRGDDSSVLPSGVYFYSLRAGEAVVTHKMVLLK